MKHEIRPLNFTKQHNRLFPQKKKMSIFIQVGLSSEGVENLLSWGTLGHWSRLLTIALVQGTLFLLGLDSSAIKKVPFDLPWISQQRTSLPFGFLLNTHSVTLRRWEISSGFHTHPQKRRCGSTTNFYAKNVLFTNLRMAEFLQMIFTLLITFRSVLAGWLGLRRIRKRSLLGIATQTIKFKSEEFANSTTKLLRTSSIFHSLAWPEVSTVMKKL